VQWQPGYDSVTATLFYFFLFRCLYYCICGYRDDVGSTIVLFINHVRSCYHQVHVGCKLLHKILSFLTGCLLTQVYLELDFRNVLR